MVQNALARRPALALMFVCLLTTSLAAQLSVVDEWRYTVRRPATGWQRPDFDARSWKEGHGGFGTRGTPGARVATSWGTRSIWLRKEFTVAAVPRRPALLIHHDEDADVFINGQRVAALEGYTTEYEVVPLDAESRKTLRVGKNLLAVRCRQTAGGQFIDVHVVNADAVPELPPAKRSTRPFQSDLLTTWGAEVTPDNAWTEYPRPQLVREGWRNLNGLWDWAVTPVERREPPDAWTGKILVPFALESRLGGVQRLLDATEALWYRRSFIASPREGTHTHLNFEAVDYRCEVRVNGTAVGTHRGGNTPFTLDVTGALREGVNELIVRVEDETEGWQLRGKQVINARGIWYTQVSGIWQTVWLETVASSFIADLDITTDAGKGTITVRPQIGGEGRARRVRLVLRDGDASVTVEAEGDEVTLTVAPEEPKLWSPDSPQLYDLELTLHGPDGAVVDRVSSYAGIRSVGKTRDADGHLRFTLNGEELFHWGPLDQGWWPDGLLTPPSDEAMRFDIDFLKRAGFNMIRKHIKVEPRRYYWHCDRLGMMVWQDHVSGGRKPKWTRLAPDPKDAEWPQEQRGQFMVELERMIATLESHPSIVVWVPFNEAWGQHRTVEIGKWMTARDPTRLVNIASGGNFWPVGDIVDHHSYPNPDFPFDAKRFGEFIKVIGEFGGHGYPVKGHLWDADRRNWGYGGLPKNEAEYRERYVRTLGMLNDFRRRGIAAGVYTQTTDVEGEVNGLLTYDRKIAKISAEELARLHERLFESANE